jgi:hypothetical protein
MTSSAQPPVGGASDQVAHWKELLVNVVPHRQCGGCVACCTDLDVDEPDFKKPRGVTCQHCTGSGCALVESLARPRLCSAWYCLWRRTTLLPEEFYPPLSNFIVFLTANSNSSILFGRLFICVVASESPADFAEPKFLDVLSALATRYRLPIILAHKNAFNMVYPDPALADAICRPETTAFTALLGEAAAWRENFNTLVDFIEKEHGRAD